MRRQAVRTIALALVALLAATGPVRAATLTFADVMQAAGANGQLRPASEVRLRVNAQSGAATAQNASTQSGSSAASQQTTSGTQTAAAQQTTQTPSTQSTSGTISQSGGNVQTVDLGDVTGTVCDCGEIPQIFKPKGGIPWWPFTGIVLICATGICHGNECTDCTVTECTNCNTTTTPEPTTLLLFSSGLLALGAAARRRYDRKQLEKEMRAATEEAQLS